MKYCTRCGIKITGNGKKFCSINCANSYRYEEAFIDWINSDSDASDKDGELSESFSRRVKSYYNNTCQSCGFSGVNPFSDKPVVQVDHIDGNPTNNTFNNLRVLCPNCHAMTDSFGALNKGNGRKHRKR